MDLPDQAIEAAAVAIAFRQHGQSIEWWAKFAPAEKERYGKIARLALEAALPHLTCRQCEENKAHD
jgi:hypothetical protein